MFQSVELPDVVPGRTLGEALVSIDIGGPVIPAVRGEFYHYSSEFTEEYPLYALMKCKANKRRPTEAATVLAHEINLMFLFGNEDQVRVCAVDVARATGQLEVSTETLFSETLIAVAGISAETFRNICLQKEVGSLVKACQSACLRGEEFVSLASGQVVAVVTDEGKHGLFLVKEVGQGSIKIEACHILL